MSSTGLGVFSIVRQNSNQPLIFPILYIGRTSQSLKGHASIELKMLINLLYTKLYIYVVVNFLSQVIFAFLLFLGMVMYANEVETKEK